MDYWIIAVTCPEVCDGVMFRRFCGTKAEVKNLIMKYIREDQDQNGSFEYGTSSEDTIVENGCELIAYGVYTDYKISYTARPLGSVGIAKL